MTEAHPVAVTGAGGSLGRSLVRRLLETGHPVRALVRKEEDAKTLRELGATPIMGDVRDEDSLEELARGCRVLFHLAAWMGEPFDEGLAHAVNVGGTENAVRAAAGAGMRRVVLAGSVSVYGPVREGVVTEESPAWSVGDLYSDTKIQAEQVAWQAAEEAGVELVVLRPTMIYGPESPSWTEIPFVPISRGLPAVVGSGEDLADPIFVDDVARAFVLAGSTPEATNETFNIAAGPRTWNDFFGRYAALAGKPLRRVPAPVARAAARSVERAERALGRRPRVVSEMVGVMTSRATYSGDKARRILGFEPEYGLDDGMRETEAWLREAGLLRRPAVALVTGAAGGLGREVARRLAEEGVKTWAADLEPPDLPGRTLKLDVTSEACIGQALATVEREDGPVDLLVNAVGVMQPGALEDQAFADVEQHVNVNALGPLRLARAVAPGMRRRGRGRIINVGSTNGFVTTPFLGAYSASKHALEALSDALRMELAPWGVEVVVVEPGAMKTGLAARAKAALLRELPASGNDWSPYLRAFLDSPLWGTANASDPAKVADRIVRLALAQRVPARRLVTLDAYPARLFALLPAAVRDAVLVRGAGLHRPPGRPSGQSSTGETAARQPGVRLGR